MENGAGKENGKLKVESGKLRSKFSPRRRLNLKPSPVGEGGSAIVLKAETDEVSTNELRLLY